jgi:hypothetical protein
VHESPAERKSLPQKSIPPRLSRGERSTREMSSKATGLAAAKLVNNQSGLRDVAVATASSLECVQVLAEASLQGCVDRLFVSCRVTA